MYVIVVELGVEVVLVTVLENVAETIVTEVKVIVVVDKEPTGVEDE